MSGPMNTLEILTQDRDEWKRRALALEVSRDKALEDLRINLDALYVRIEEVRELKSILQRVVGWMIGPTCNDCDPDWSCQISTHEKGCAAVLDINRALTALGWGPDHAEAVSKERHVESRAALKAEIARRGDELQDLRALRDEVLDVCVRACDCACLRICWE